MSKRITVPESGKVGPFVNLSTRYGQVQKQLVMPCDPRAPGQLACRSVKLKLHVLSQAVEHTLVLGARPCSPGVRCVQHFPFLGFLPVPVDGWCDITDLFVKRYGVPAAGRAIFIRTRQHINGWNDPPKQVRAIVRAA